jgi:hypothetical protein
MVTRNRQGFLFPFVLLFSDESCDKVYFVLASPGNFAQEKWLF